MTTAYVAPGALEAAFDSGNEDRLVEELQKVSSQKSRRQTRALLIFRILEKTKSPRVRNAAALALADMRMASAKDELIDLLKKADTRGHRGTILYALGELGVNLPLGLLVDIIIEDAYECREEALSFIVNEKFEHDSDPRRLRRKLKATLSSGNDERSHAVNAALECLGTGG